MCVDCSGLWTLSGCGIREMCVDCSGLWTLSGCGIREMCVDCSGLWTLWVWNRREMCVDCCGGIHVKLMWHCCVVSEVMGSKVSLCSLCCDW